MANTRELSPRDASHEALPVDQFERMLAAVEVRRAAALNAIDNRRVAERLRAAALDAEEAAAPVDGGFALVPDGSPAAEAHSEPA
jgi:hypothetical protein